MKSFVLSITLLICLVSQLQAQTSAASFASFRELQKTFARPDESFRRKEDTLQKQFAAGLKWPANYIYIFL
jgi:hypothetical protein